jgi:hypothetical protein
MKIFLTKDCHRVVSVPATEIGIDKVHEFRVYCCCGCLVIAFQDLSAQRQTLDVLAGNENWPLREVSPVDRNGRKSDLQS